MKINRKFIKPIIGICLIALVSISCEKEFNSLESDVINNENATDFTNNSERYNVKAYTKVLDPIQTSNLPLYALGVYKDPFYGNTTSSIVAQVSSAVLDPSFGDNPVLDSVVLTIPYFSRSTGISEDNILEFELDSVFGSDPIKLSIYENDFFLRNFDPNLGLNEQQTYYANGATSESEMISPASLENFLIEEISTFAPDNRPIALENEEGEVTETINPSIRIKFDNLDYWQTKIINKQGEPELSNQSNFNNYFRGLYFKAEAVNNSGSLILLNLSQANANITLYYKKDDATEEGERENATYSLSFSGNRVNLINNNFTFPAMADPVNGDEQLFLKGSQGAMAVLNLFDGDEEGNSEILSDLKSFFVEPESNKKKRLLNEANLVVYVDQIATANLQEPQRIYLYNLTNHQFLADFQLDVANNTFPEASIINHLGPLQTNDNNKGIKYKFRITQHLSNILFNDSTNVKLGLAVSGNVNLEEFNQFKVLTSENNFNRVPISSIITPRSTILHGNQSPIEEKRLYLEIFYTEPEN